MVPPAIVKFRDVDDPLPDTVLDTETAGADADADAATDVEGWPRSLGYNGSLGSAFHLYSPEDIFGETQYLTIYTLSLLLLFDSKSFFSLVCLSRSTASSIESSRELEMLPDCLLFFLVWICLVGIASAEADKRKKTNLTVDPRRKFLDMIDDDSSAGNVEMWF